MLVPSQHLIDDDVVYRKLFLFSASHSSPSRSVEHAVLRHNCNGKYCENLLQSRSRRRDIHTRVAKGKDFIIYETLMLQLEAHKINDAVSVHLQQ